MENDHTLRERRQRIQLILLMATVFVFGFTLGNQYTTSLAQSGGDALPSDVAPLFEPLYETYNLIEAQYIDMPEPEVLAGGAIRGMVEALGDPYSNYIDPESYELINSSLSGEYQGIGAVIIEDGETGEVIVVNVFEGSPADAAGVREGDAFNIVNGDNVVGLTISEVGARVRGEAGSVVNITMRRGEELIDFVIVRAHVEIPNVEYEVLDGDIGYVAMFQFTAPARSQLDEALDAIEANILNGLILDLRGNPGGYLSSATEIAGLFMEEGIILIEDFGNANKEVYVLREGDVIQTFADGSERVYSTNADYRGLDMPIVVLVDERSASASELVAGAWQDHGVVTLVGTTSFGKGSVQIQNSLGNGGGVRLTVARWLTPGGDWISEQGVTPDIIVEIPEGIELEEGEDPQLDAAVEFIFSQIQD